MMSAAPMPYEVRCPLHGSIPFDERERRIVDHPLVQRLRYISQLGFASLVFPGATHSRFSHSLGVMHLAGRVLQRVADASDTLARAGYQGDALAYCFRIVRLAGLLHDVGHPPFSHTFEPLLPPRRALPLPWDWYGPGTQAPGTQAPGAASPGAASPGAASPGTVPPPGTGESTAQATHEDFSVAAVYSLAQGPGALLTSAEARDICALIDGRVLPGPALSGAEGRRPIYPLLKQIISGEIDADRMDYLRRDAHYAGVAYGLFDLARLIQSLACADLAEGLVMTLDHGAVYAYENFLMARFHMAMQVYFHKTLLPFEHFLKRAIEEGEIDFRMDGSLESLLGAREDRVLEALYQAREGRWAARIVHRQPIARVLQLDDVTDRPARARVLAAVQRLQGQGLEIVHLREERALSTLGGASAISGYPIYVRQSQLGREAFRPLHTASMLLERYNQVFVIEGLYCDPRDHDAVTQALRPILADLPSAPGHPGV